MQIRLVVTGRGKGGGGGGGNGLWVHGEKLTLEIGEVGVRGWATWRIVMASKCRTWSLVSCNRRLGCRLCQGGWECDEAPW